MAERQPRLRQKHNGAQLSTPIDEFLLHHEIFVDDEAIV
eukprot:CAMPEP_0203933824 /NCGR_PEP_ID=MMETSP0359-20131031/71928_1 /ASSEMBLY_ACC=CAM_ASM_000338 /TAXON_ID=268821 /ORGANISM="Scrippsiella Hangoei, Strain SHTV-5" /LENGTH=38 /DNA_ID= /DNA_START= /DNA_END= /DNA_ORIENTATION=